MTAVASSSSVAMELNGVAVVVGSASPPPVPSSSGEGGGDNAGGGGGPCDIAALAATLKSDRIDQGLCPTCGIRLYKLKKSPSPSSSRPKSFLRSVSRRALRRGSADPSSSSSSDAAGGGGGENGGGGSAGQNVRFKPLTIEGEVVRGQCVRCSGDGVGGVGTDDSDNAAAVALSAMVDDLVVAADPPPPPPLPPPTDLGGDDGGATSARGGIGCLRRTQARSFAVRSTGSSSVDWNAQYELQSQLYGSDADAIVASVSSVAAVGGGDASLAAPSLAATETACGTEDATAGDCGRSKGWDGSRRGFGRSNSLDLARPSATATAADEVPADVLAVAAGYDPHLFAVTDPSAVVAEQAAAISSAGGGTGFSYPPPQSYAVPIDPDTGGRRSETVGATYEGEYDAHGRKHGRGELRWANGDKYEGMFFEGVREGEGTLHFADGTEYVGTWSNNSMHGTGTRRFPNGNVYVGSYLDGKRSGQGRCYFANGDLYVGSWIDDRIDGFGRYYYNHGRSFEGRFRNGKRDGRGKYQLNDGRVDIYRYQDDVRVGEGVRWSADRRKAWRLFDGKVKGKIGLEEAAAIADRCGRDVQVL